MKKLFWVGFLQAFGVAIYCFLISGMFKLMDSLNLEPPAFIGLVFILLSLVFSAAITGLIVFGFPGLLVLKGKIKEALITLAFTFIFLAIFLLVIFLIAGL